VTSPAALPRIEEIIDGSAAAPRIEALLPAGVRHRQLKVRTLLTGMMLTQADRRPAHLTEVHAALTALTGPDQARLGVTEDWEAGPHQLTYRQAGRTFGLVTAALAKDEPDGTPSATLTAALDDLLEASIPPEHKDTSTALAVDWTDMESFSRPPPRGSKACADPEASWGHRNSNLPGPKGEMFFGYYHSAAAMTREETGPEVPGLTRRMTLSSCHADPVRAFTPVLTRCPKTASRSVTSSPTPATPTATLPPGPSRSAPPAHSSSATCTRTTAAPRAPTPAPSSPTATSTAPPPQSHCCTWGHQPPALLPNTSPRMTSRPLNSPATSSAASPPTTPTATTASPAPPPWARSAAHSARTR
jgi:hypothetical protein